ncbi:MAG: 2-oxo acid dehydrogenase subunit E2 [Sphaerochaeta sp.]|jgi:hypothetical protein|nr:2-oxo acid dehydrogenase subunit E2 [Sphaerochaeta sp.]MCH3920142.1 2-oxo acid dehydrogenase subunit E2 [Sphaerochaeta sp.]MCI2045197.1 2-oxo acid dehydrogenase subunit E2 [Sphaerochaeta sp.]MCI2076047.1 2-oxo acid dehydrogenase subunit E2 [Sphaerochaeta sp.]MCI2096327.1 2-oxo acid dehydrogenase subunit E2 [Sphaerochaeta sp.]
MGRNDAKRVWDIPTLIQIYPFMMKRRCDSMVFQTVTIDVTNILTFIKDHTSSQGKKYRMFEVVLGAMVRLMAERPELNRFIAGKRYWQRNEISVNFVVKENLADDAPEHSTPLYFTPEMSFDEVACKIEDTIIAGQTPHSEGYTDRAIGFFLHFPTWFISMVVGIAGWMDRHGIAPKALRDADGLHTSAFVSNMGSIGLDGTSPHHHLYEWGTTSIFMTMGMMKRTKLPDGTWRASMEFGFTVDERITDGWYFTQSLRVFEKYLQEPELLLQPAKLPPPLLSKKQYQAKLRAERKQAKAAKRS